MFRELQHILSTAGMPFGDEELLDTLWLLSRLPQGPNTLLAAQWAAAQQTADRSTKPALAPPSNHISPSPPSRGSNPGAGPPSSGAETITDPDDLVPLTGAQPTGNSTDLDLRVPGLKALGGDLAFDRALRPLKRRVPSTRETELAEEATAAAQADTRVPQVVLRPRPERWLRLALIIDSADSMLLWERHFGELRSLFERSGAFRQIEVHQVSYGSPQSPRSIALTRPWGGKDAQTLSPQCVTDPSGRTMVIVVTDGTAPAWRDGRMQTVLQGWAAAGPTALIHVLPRSLWAGTGITADTWHITTPRAGAPNTDWQVTHPILPPAVSQFATVPIPVLELTPPGLTSWAGAVTTLGQPVPLRLWEPHSAAPAQPAADPTASPLAFTRTASPQSVRLAAYLAAMAPLTVPVMQLVHSCLPGRRRTAALAEVFLSGLLAPLPHAAQPSTDIRQRFFDFTAEAKDLLLDTVPTTELLSCSRRVGKQMEYLVGRSPDFPAWLMMSSQQPTPRARPQPFAYIGQSLLIRLGRDTSSILPSPEPAVVPEPAAKPERATKREPAAKREPAGLLAIDIAWLLMVAEQSTPGDPQVTDWGSLTAAVSRMEAEIFDVPVYPTPVERAAVLVQQLVHVPALERSNALFASAAAYSYLVASGLKVTVSPEQVRDLARQVKAGAAHSTIAESMQSWIR